MGKKVGIEVSIAAAEAVGLCDVDVVAAYPITPQTHVVEHLSELVADGHLDAEFVPVESEHSAMSVCCGSSAAGARTFTATAAQGLALMSEIVYIASTMRLPIVMFLSNRALSAPLSIWNDHSDTMMVRDSGWIQVFCENGQEVYDAIFHAFRVAEDPRVSLPVMINVDGFNLTHVIEPIEFWTKEMVKEYLPPFKPLNTLHPNKVVSMGAFGMPEIYTEQKYAHDHVLLKSREVLLEAWDEMAKLTGRKYSPVETYKADDAEILVFGMGSICETASIAVDKLREQGKSVGLASLRLWRPLPKDELKSILGKAKEVVVLDRSLAPGAANAPVTSEMRALMYHEAQRPKIHCMIAGLGGRDVTPQDVVNMVEQAIVEKDDDYHFYGVRG
ncbi:transketolase C-terminal domain-containing protein [Desulfomonile tiedjei]|uniref:2-oxoacid:ferredoxin oxidoreductase, alpha subunit n=1 Tax=Desulfomonile tiedjei (strain ATCC 49306 / DSM 6799 / DCB-1) TaxID=706587 RepID=I4CF64_DESTA|nr:transketolase C-terminal domain-containing protein [Desulfomonile tiedjei]AFM28205.1 2-oxoacid:ferredoxin oxidoreductase, alpha subunit [Desulfomonile tiedjei DSM 6799]